ncbi:MAG: hypothetical protein LBV71_00115 [Prevotella sp.]|jgi:hypothetical protein|nr:hypothetical protein [Prevotella sp.]
MNLEVNPQAIEQSFDRIAKELLIENALYINDKVFRFTEIEFYYYNEEFHPDKYTHEHSLKEGQWRFHNQGIDITFNSDDNLQIDGGILIRGVLLDKKYINGPRKIITAFFEAFGNITDNTNFILKSSEKRDVEIIKTFRQLPNKIEYPIYHEKHYRYIAEIEKVKISSSIKDAILKDYQNL